MFLSAADVTLDVKRKPRLTNNRINTKPWFNAQCRTARRKFHLAKRIHNKFRTQENCEKLRSLSKEYKATMNACIKEHNVSVKSKLKNVKKGNPKEY